MEWYYANANGRSGPVTEEAFAELVRSGAIGPSTLVWNVTMPEWAEYGTQRQVAQPFVAEVSWDRPAIGAPSPAYCTHCGRPVSSASDLVMIAGREVCGFCKPELLQQMREGATPWARAVNYGGFWARFAASLIDSVIITVVNVAITTTLVGLAAASGDPSAGLASLALSYAAGIAVGVAYEGYFLVNKGATPGKMAMGLRVVMASGGPITWGTAIGRYFGKMVSGIILGIGFLMAAWDPEKRTLHDRMVNTRVIKV